VAGRSITGDYGSSNHAASGRDLITSEVGIILQIAPWSGLFGRSLLTS
jgi:hypothetical protein